MKVRKFLAVLASGVLNLRAVLVAYLRNSETYVLSRDKNYLPPEVSYEVDVSEMIPQFKIYGDGDTMAICVKHHLVPGGDGNMYLCCFEITEENLVSTIRFWLAHQVLVEKFGIDIVNIGAEFAGDGEFFQKARALKLENPSLGVTDIVLSVCDAQVEIEEIWFDYWYYLLWLCITFHSIMNLKLACYMRAFLLLENCWFF